MLIKGGIEYEMQDYVSAEETMVAAAALPSVKRKVVDHNMFNFKILTYTEKDRCSIFLLLAKSYIKNKKSKECKNVINQAIAQFAGTPE
ncbi:MAG: hypothetical protein KDD45_09565 [Bdellovibrionales bacterium]|nr:hypothetical protein [Bdellovibrionales bacterium]